ncbi:hypothetical protein ARC63_05505 [Stenotrophomonas geniculata ATCC 19374 = JCM 13324]|nr:hypothetical protein ARC63_05505 [Stenotrophomonas geniculata ATCC 19374 = JCM 13324]
MSTHHQITESSLRSEQDTPNSASSVPEACGLAFFLLKRGMQSMLSCRSTISPVYTQLSFHE